LIFSKYDFNYSNPLKFERRRTKKKKKQVFGILSERTRKEGREGREGRKEGKEEKLNSKIITSHTKNKK
jgi:hypothetical protein